MIKKIALLGGIIITTLSFSSSANAQVPGAYPGYNPYAPIQRHDSLSPQCSPDAFWYCPNCANSGYGGPGCYCSCLSRGGYDPLNPTGAIQPHDPPTLQHWWYSTRVQSPAHYQPYPYQSYSYQPYPALNPLSAQAAGPGPVYPRDPAYDQYLNNWWYSLWR